MELTLVAPADNSSIDQLSDTYPERGSLVDDGVFTRYALGTMDEDLDSESFSALVERLGV